MHYRPFKSVLVANRGEIAVRIVKEAQASDLRAIAVYADADQKAWHVQGADAAVHIGPSPAAESYLSIPKLLAAAKSTKAEAIHPGYGFLSENADFAQAVIDAGIVWIGPSPDAVRAMGDKGNAKELARKANVPVIPGYDGDDQSDARLLSEARKIGWPVLIKAALGGGGRGQRKVIAEADFVDALAAARREALSAFASGRVILERALEEVRHIEVQVFADSHGNTIHLGERDCSVQRRNQKILEEAPAAGIDAALRARMGEAATALARTVGYTNAGTVEFLVDRSGNFWFLEMNTRIQVEHPVTEHVTGTNLIRWQFDIAAGKPLPLTQKDVRITGHAIEARLCAEDPGDGFAPQTGQALWRTAGAGARIDDAGDTSGHVSVHYDSMIAKVIVSGATRDEARSRLAASLGQVGLYGIRNNVNYLQDILNDADFAAGTADIAWLSRRSAWTDSNLDTRLGHIAALWLARGAADGWRSNACLRTIIHLRERHALRTFVVQDGKLDGLLLGHVSTHDAGLTHEVEVTAPTGERLRATVHTRDHHIHVRHQGRNALFEDVTYAPAQRKDPAGAGAIRAPMAGRIIKLAATPGQSVARGDILVILEAMKLEHELRAAIDGVVDSVAVGTGDQVSIRQVLVTVN